jgi:hypothetical protein
MAYKIPLNEVDIAGLVARLRDSSRPKPVAGQVILPNYDTGAANKLYAGILGPVASRLNGIFRLSIAANGALLTFPMGGLVTAPGFR